VAAHSPSQNPVYVHGGVSGKKKPRLPSLADALTASMTEADALDAAEAAVRCLEDNPELNAGYGSVLNRSGGLELDAGIARGSTGSWAGVANVTVRHPITLARRVLEKTPHVLLAGPGAMSLADGLEILAETTPEQLRRYQEARLNAPAGEYGKDDHVDTVGAVALDVRRDLVAASSTGGVLGKLPGRVGDSPIFGAGIYADERVAVVGTGVGELFLETLACLRVGRLIEEGLEPQAACEAVIQLLGEREPKSAGLLALDVEGRLGAAFRGGSWAVEGPDGPIVPERVS
jgi:L-asparaginase / beta-aspartyl-peptidase